MAKKAVRFLVDSALLARPLSKKEKWDLSRISKYLTKEQKKLVLKLVKQKKAKINFVKKGYSFLIVNKDILPQIDTKLKEAEEVNKLIERQYYREAFKNFSERAWQAIPQYIGPTVIGLKNGKNIATLLLFTGKSLQVLLLGNAGIGKSDLLQDIAKLSDKEIGTISEIKTPKQDLKGCILASLSFKNKLSKYSLVPLKKNILLSTAAISKFHLSLVLREPNLEKFADLAEKILTEERVNVSQMDLSFIKKYAREAKKVKVRIPLRISNDIKDFSVILKEKEDLMPWPITGKTIEAMVELVKASARMEFRRMVSVKDLDRVFGILSEGYKEVVNE